MDSQLHDEVTETPERIRLLKRRVDSARDGLALHVAELSRRRRDAVNVRLQVRRHPAAVAALALGAAGLVAAGTIAAVRSARGRRPPRSVPARIADAVRSLPFPARAAPPRRVAAGRGLFAIGSRIAWSFAPAVAALIARRVAASLSEDAA